MSSVSVNSTAEVVVDERLPALAAPAVPTVPELDDDDLPLTIIEPTPGWRFVNFAELWRYRELLYFLTLRDVKVRYKQTVLGAAWAILLAPVTMLLLVVAALGVGTLLAALPVAYRAFRYVVPFGVQLWMFAPPTIYMPVETVVGPNGHALLPLNPAYGLIYNFRQS